MSELYWLSRILFYVLVFAITCTCGRFVELGRIKVNYTRKVEHFALFLIPPALYTFLPFEKSFSTVIVDMMLMVGFCMIHIKWIRNASALIDLSFKCVDRPEDRPHTLFWMTSQIFVGYLAIFVVVVAMAMLELNTDLIHIPLLITAIGDGLAEPVGVKFGRHKYRVRGFLMAGQRQYTRSYEGSAVVFSVGLIVCLCFAPFFTFWQLIAAVALVPLIMTLAEAVSPHTWDMPLLILAGGAVLVGVKVLL